MSTRLEIELTSSRPDGVWTWRKAGAKLPKGELSGDMLPAGTKVGDVLRADADVLIDGVDILAVLPPKEARKERFESIQVVGTRRDEPLVTQTLAPKGRGGGRDRGDRGPRRDGDRDRGPRRDGDRGPRRDGDRPRGERRDGRPGGSGGDRPQRTRRPAPEPKPRAKRLRPGRTHRNAVLDSLAPEHRPIAEQVLRGGVPAVRQAVDKQNEVLRQQNQPEIHGDELVALAEGLLPKLRSAEWRDKADSALSILDEIDLRDLRSVVVAADTGARDDETRALAQQLRDGLARRVEEEHTAWLGELTSTLAEGRVVRALRLSSRPPKAGAPVPTELTARLTSATVENLTLDSSQERWAMVIDALAFSPVRMAVTPAAVPAEPSDELKAAVAKVASRVPHIAALFGIDASAAPKRRRPAGKGGERPVPPPTPAAPVADAPAEPEPAAVETEPVAVETEPVADAPAEPVAVETEETPVVAAPVAEEPVAVEPEAADAEEPVAVEPEAADAEPEAVEPEAADAEPEPEPEDAAPEPEPEDAAPEA